MMTMPETRELVDVAEVAAQPTTRRVLIAASEINADLPRALAQLGRVYQRAAILRPPSALRDDLQVGADECRRMRRLATLVWSVAETSGVSHLAAAVHILAQLDESVTDPTFSDAVCRECRVAAIRVRALADHLAERKG